MKKKIGILTGLNPKTTPHGNRYNIGKILSQAYDLDLIGFEEGYHNKFKKYFKFKQYTRIKANNKFKWFLKDAINLYKYCRKEKPDILFSIQRPDFQGPLVTIFAKIFGIKSIVRYSGAYFDMHRFKKGVWNKLTTYLTCGLLMKVIKYSDKIICMGKEQKKELIRAGCNPKKINILLQPTNQKIFKPVKNKAKLRKKLNLPLNKKIIIYVGNITNFKGADTLINVISKFSKDKNYLFIVLGKSITQYAAKLRKFDNVLLTGRVPHYKVAEYYQSADLHIHPSYVEGFPKVVLEAAACGLSTIARDIVGIDRIAKKTFVKDKELIEYVRHGKWEASNKSKLPKEYSWKNLEKKYLDIFAFK